MGIGLFQIFQGISSMAVRMGRRRSCCSFKIRSPIIREFLAELLGKKIGTMLSLLYNTGTYVLVMFGCSSLAQSVLSLQTKGGTHSTVWG